jgi:hypothetical protein
VQLTLDLVSGNSSWWKAVKYRRETAAYLRRLRREGWRLKQKTRLPRATVDTRCFTRYVFHKAG